MSEISVIDQVEYVGRLYYADLISLSDYQGYLKLRLNDVFSADDQARIWAKMKAWEKEKEEWY